MAALDALNSEHFPIYAKIHGDFRFKSIKNLSSDLLINDSEIQKCFLSASNRYGLIVTGYSGRDDNVMAMFNLALDQNNPFPQGLFWTVSDISHVTKSVNDLIELARTKGVYAHIIETATFDIMLSKMWRQLSEKPEKLDLKVRTVKAQSASITMPRPGNKYPILRTNALAITECPNKCARVDYAAPITFQELKDKIWNLKPDAVVSYTDQILFWGNPIEIYKLIDKDKVRTIDVFPFENPVVLITQSGIIMSFFEHALARSLCYEKPLVLRVKNGTYYVVVKHDEVNNSILQPLKDSLGNYGNPCKY